MFDVIIFQKKLERMQAKQSPRPDVGSQAENKYNTITYEARKTLIEMVLENGLSIYRAAKILNINHSTAKAILRKYRRFGHIFKRKHENDVICSESYESKITGPAFNQQQKSLKSNEKAENVAGDRREAQNRNVCSASPYQASPYFCYYFPIVPINWPMPNHDLI